MKWQPVRNKDYSSRDTYCQGECPRFIESATLSIHLSGKQICKSDLQLTFTPHIKECSLLKKKNDKDEYRRCLSEVSECGKGKIKWNKKICRKF